MNTELEKKNWKVKKLPKKRASINFTGSYTEEQYDLIKRGFVPQQMEDRWFIYWEKDKLYFHRGSTGYCVYVVSFKNEGDRHVVSEALANRDDKQYTNKDDQEDVTLLGKIIENRLLRPSEEGDTEPPGFMQPIIEADETGREYFANLNVINRVVRHYAQRALDIQEKYAKKELPEKYANSQLNQMARYMSFDIGGESIDEFVYIPWFSKAQLGKHLIKQLNLTEEQAAEVFVSACKVFMNETLQTACSMPEGITEDEWQERMNVHFKRWVSLILDMPVEMLGFEKEQAPEQSS